MKTTFALMAGSLVLISTLTLSGCGQPVCVAGIGDCEVKVKVEPQKSGGGKLKLTADTSTRMKPEERREITIEGGVGDITFPAPSAGEFAGQLFNGKIVYIAPKADKVPAEGISVRITAKDSAYKTSTDVDHIAYIVFDIVPN